METRSSVVELENGPPEIEGDDSAKNYFHRLPDEIILQIFLYIPKEERCQTVSKVCKHWCCLVGQQKRSMDEQEDEKKESVSDLIDDTIAGIHFNHLPPEIILRIFKLISPAQRLNCLALVCRHWHRLARDPLLMRYLELKKNSPVEKVLMLIRHYPRLLVFKASRLDCVNECIDEVLMCCQGIECLDIGFCQLTYATLFSIAQKASNLRHLNMEGSHSVDASTLEVICSLLPCLEALNLSHCVNITDEALLQVATQLRSLRRLNVDGVQWITDESVGSLCKRHGSTLDYLLFDGCELTSLALIHIARHCHCLTILSVSYGENLTDSIAGAVRRLDCLEVLILRKAQCLTKSALELLFDPEHSHLTRLTHLNLNECSAVDDTIVFMICALCSATLRVLSLNWCWEITDSGLARIVDCLAQLEWLSLVGNHGLYGDALTDANIRAPHSLPRLRMLNLAQCNRIKDEQMYRLALDRPQMFIFNYYGERFADPEDNGFHYEAVKNIDISPHCDHYSIYTLDYPS